MASEYLQAWRVYNLPGQPMPELSCSQEKKKKNFLDDQTEPLVLQLVPIASGPVTGHH